MPNSGEYLKGGCHGGGRRQSGAAIVEYMVLALVLVATLFLKYDGEHSVVQLLATAVVDYMRSLTYIISMP
ncbi:MAG: hypothetical protein LBP52_04585 [Burkholderiaceae bacterium]|jgi:hypothetical protein|nr:hypothetical protein [Burkholderiaceae bacterium]